MMLPEWFASNHISYMIDIGTQGHLHGGHVEDKTGGVRLIFRIMLFINLVTRLDFG